VAERSRAWTVFARSNTAIVGSNPTEAWMLVCVLCAFLLFLQSQVTQPADLIKKVSEDLSLDKPLHVIYKVSKLAYRIWVILIANKRVIKKGSRMLPSNPTSAKFQTNHVEIASRLVVASYCILISAVIPTMATNIFREFFTLSWKMSAWYLD
jgi:hypothetical protein